MSVLEVRPLSGKRILVLEDEPLIAMEIEHTLYAAGAGQVDLVLSLNAGVFDIVKEVHGAVLDMNIRGESSEPVARYLLKLGIPFIIVSGAEGIYLDPGLSTVPRLGKPNSPSELVVHLTDQLNSETAAIARRSL